MLNFLPVLLTDNKTNNGYYFKQPILYGLCCICTICSFVSAIYNPNITSSACDTCINVQKCAIFYAKRLLHDVVHSLCTDDDVSLINTFI